MDSLYSTESDNNKIDSLIKKYNTTEFDPRISESHFYNSKNLLTTTQKEPSQFNCNLCNNTGENYLILECQHIFHVKCLAETQSDTMYNYKKMDDSFFQSMKCPECNVLIDKEELLFLHNKYNKVTSNLLNDHEKSLLTLEQQLKMLQEEIRSCYDYKHKLECDKEKSKNLIKTLITLID
jgi:hypothetical protein